MTAHILGFPRIGLHRELKRATEAYWHGELEESALLATGKKLRLRHWHLQQSAGLDYVTVGDFSWYDHVLDTSAMLGVIPGRFQQKEDTSVVSLTTYFRMARGRGSNENDSSHDTFACEMTKWFDTNYHYLVPEFSPGQSFRLASYKLFDEIEEAQAAGYKVKPVILGPLSYLWLGKEKYKRDEDAFDRLELLDQLLPVYAEILQKLKSYNIEWVQIDEPALVLDLPQAWKNAYESAYNRLQIQNLNILLATYFENLDDNINLVVNLPVAGLHIDVVRGEKQLSTVLDQLPAYKVLSIGVVDGRNIWRNDFEKSLQLLQPLKEKLGDRLWVSTSCSLLHTPVDLSEEKQLDDEIKSWLAFATQKIKEVALLRQAVDEGLESIQNDFDLNHQAIISRNHSKRIHNTEVKKRFASIKATDSNRNSPYQDRAEVQREKLSLPLFPTTTIGSFPQTQNIRVARRNYKSNKIDKNQYEEIMKAEIKKAIENQEKIGLDVLVHGEAERNDMVEYFGELLDGFAFTENGWVQSYGSRCVKPPIIYGDVSRPQAMTVEWSLYAKSLTDKLVKGMLTGPVTILQWSFVRNDQPRSQTTKQIALALRDEVADLEKAGIQIIQIDEPALREGLPLKEKDWHAYLSWAVESFQLTAAVVNDKTQMHTHMCYAEFNDIIDSIAAMDADVITIETSRSDMELLDAFTEFEYPNEIGPGVYDIHSPRVPKVEEMVKLLEKAKKVIPADRLWVNPDCGLKTRAWPETMQALHNMVLAAQQLRLRTEDIETSNVA